MSKNNFNWSRAATFYTLLIFMMSQTFSYGQARLEVQGVVTSENGMPIPGVNVTVKGESVGAVTDYKYSKALTDYGKEWSWEEMNGFLIKPAKWIKGNKMGFAGLKSEKDRASVILYLNQSGDSPKPLP